LNKGEQIKTARAWTLAASAIQRVVVRFSQIHQIFIPLPSHELQILFSGNLLAQNINILKVVQFDPLVEMDVFNRSGHLDIATIRLSGLLSVCVNEFQQFSEPCSTAHVEGVGSVDVPVLFAVWFDTTRHPFPLPFIQ
jgi:hypothetical protein